MGTAELVNLAVARIAKRASESMLRSAKAMLSSGWRVARIPLEPHELEREREEHYTSVMDELVAACALLALMHPKVPASAVDPMRAFLAAQSLRTRARLLLTFEHIEAKVLVYEWRPPGARAHSRQPTLQRPSSALYTPDDEAQTRDEERDEAREEPETDDLSSTLAVWTELRKVNEMLKKRRSSACASGKCDGDACSLKGASVNAGKNGKRACDTCAVCEKVEQAHAKMRELMAEFSVEVDAKSSSGSVARRAFPPTHITLKAHTRAMPEYHMYDGDKIKSSVAKEEAEVHFERVNEARQRDFVGGPLVMEAYKEEITRQTAQLRAATDTAREAIREARGEISRIARNERNERNARGARAGSTGHKGPTGSTGSTSRGVIVVSADAERHWALSHARTIGDVWLEAAGYTMTVHGHAVHAEFGRETVPIRPMPHAMTHYVVPCVLDGERTVYYVPTTGGGAMHSLAPSNTSSSPIYDLAQRAAAQTHHDSLRAIKYTFVEPSVDTSFGFGNEKDTAIKKVREARERLRSEMRSPQSYFSWMFSREKNVEDGDVVDAAFTDIGNYLKSKDASNETNQIKPLVDAVRRALNDYVKSFGNKNIARDLTPEVRERALFDVDFATYENRADSEQTLQNMIAIATSESGAHFLSEKTLAIATNGDATLQLLRLLLDAYKNDTARDDDQMTKAAANAYLAFHEALRRHDEGAVTNFFTDWRTTLFWLIRRAPDNIGDAFYQSVGGCIWTDGDLANSQYFFKVVIQNAAWLALKLFKCNERTQCVEAAGKMLETIQTDTDDGLMQIAKYQGLASNFEASSASSDSKTIRSVCMRAIREFFRSVQTLGDADKASVYTLLMWGAGTRDVDVRRKGAELLYKHREHLKDYAHADLFHLACSYDIDIARQADVKSTFRIFFGVKFEGASEMRKSLRHLLKFAEERAKKGRTILAFSQNEFQYLDLAEWKGEWTKFVGDGNDTMNNPDHIDSRIRMLTEYPNVNRLISNSSFAFVEYYTTLEETLAKIREGTEEESARIQQRRLIKELARREHVAILPEKMGVNDKCGLRTMHLLELRWDKKNKNSTEEDESILAYIEGCECKTCFHTVVEDWGDKKAGHASPAYQRFLAAMSQKTTNPELYPHRLRWRKRGCNEALVSLCKKGLRDRDKDALQAVTEKCNDARDSVMVAKIQLLKTQEAPCDNGTISAMDSDTSPLPLHSMQNERANLKDDFSNWHTKVSEIKFPDPNPDPKREKTLRAMQNLINVLDLSNSGRDIEGAGDLLRYVDINYVLTCGQKTRFEYLKSIWKTRTERPLLRALVEVHGLENKKHYNGKVGRVIRDADVNGRFEVQLDTQISVKLENLYVILTSFMETRAFASLENPQGPRRTSWPSLAAPVRATRAPPSSLQAYHWLTFANEVTLYSERRPGENELSSALQKLRPLFEESVQRWEDTHAALNNGGPRDADTSNIARKYYELLAKGAEHADVVEEMKESISTYVDDIIKTNVEGEGWTFEQGVLQLWLFLDLKLLCGIRKLVGLYEPYGTHIKWLLHTSVLRRKRLVRSSLASGNVSLRITSGDMEEFLGKDKHEQQYKGQMEAARDRDIAQKQVANILTWMRLKKQDELPDFQKVLRKAKEDRALVDAGGFVSQDDFNMYRFLRNDLETYKLLLADKEASSFREGIEQIEQMLQAFPEIGAVPAYFQLMRVTRPLNKQPSKLREFIEASELDENQKRIMLESSTVEEADKALLEYEKQKMRFGGKAEELIKEFINKMEERQERPKTQKINKLTPIATGRAGFITLAFFGGGLYQILSGGAWIRVLAGAYGDEAYSHAAGFYYTAQTLMVLRGAAHETGQDGRQMGRPMGRRMRRDLGISIFESRVKSDVVAAMMHEKDKARSVSRLLWRLPCDAPCGSIVYLCCDDAPLKRGTARSSAIAVIDVLTLVVDAETSRLLERHVARDVDVKGTKDDGGVERRKKRKGVLNEIKRFAAAVRDDNDTIVGNFEIEHKRSDRSLDTEAFSPKFKPHIVQNHMKSLTWRVFVPEIGLLWCFPPKLRKGDETKTTKTKIAEDVARSLVETAGIRIKHEEDVREAIKARLEKLDQLLTKRKEGEGADA